MVAAVQSVNAAESSRRDYQVTVGYWNDNFVSTRQFEPVLNVGKDDYITSSLCLQIGLPKAERWWSVNVYHNTLTNRDADFRTDLLSIYGAVDAQFRDVRGVLGIGLISRGNYGGGAFQELYHELRDFAPMDIPYLDGSSTGLLLVSGLEYDFVERRLWTVGCFLRNSYSSTPGPGGLRVGLQTELSNFVLRNRLQVRVEGQIGYLTAYNQDEIIAPMFTSGGYQAVSVSVGQTGHMLGTVWLSLNQYGIRQTYFGVALTFGWNGDRFVGIGDVVYP